MLSYCLKCKKKIHKVSMQKFQKQLTVKQLFYQHVLYVVVKNQNLLKSNKQKDY